MLKYITKTVLTEHPLCLKKDEVGTHGTKEHINLLAARTVSTTPVISRRSLRAEDLFHAREVRNRIHLRRRCYSIRPSPEFLERRDRCSPKTGRGKVDSSR
jgi:hypothetical protein